MNKGISFTFKTEYSAPRVYKSPRSYIIYLGWLVVRLWDYDKPYQPIAVHCEIEE